MKSIISLIGTLLLAGSIAPIYITVAVATWQTLRDGGHDTWATWTPWIAILVAILLLKIIFTIIKKLLGYIFE